MTQELLDKRYRKVIRLLNYMLDEKNDDKIAQCYYIITQINERKMELYKSKQNYLKSILWKN